MELNYYETNAEDATVSREPLINAWLKDFKRQSPKTTIAIAKQTPSAEQWRKIKEMQSFRARNPLPKSWPRRTDFCEFAASKRTEPETSSGV